MLAIDPLTVAVALELAVVVSVVIAVACGYPLSRWHDARRRPLRAPLVELRVTRG